MSFDFYIAADRPIPEIKPRGQEILTVGDMIRMNVPDGPVPWKEMDENSKVLCFDPAVSNPFLIEDASYALEIMSDYTDLNHMYTVSVSDMNRANYLYNYVMTLDEEINLEIWHLWNGYDYEDEIISRKHLSRSALVLSDFEAPLNESWCIAIKS
ncbi:hypothetical protein [Paenibacillus agilis]|uniref:Uncharacterized protein n=1 Tax=Paenibacillus agilis TaxID=3020863 RepID=A0A559J2J6_9BACL|nr:hypothetical protein [Paenibacillus agilis]TVX94108.1 hypothetical protein FPZ44_14230 [Paenibacillus agilis]